MWGAYGSGQWKLPDWDIRFNLLYHQVSCPFLWKQLHFQKCCISFCRNSISAEIGLQSSRNFLYQSSSIELVLYFMCLDIKFYWLAQNSTFPTGSRPTCEVCSTNTFFKNQYYSGWVISISYHHPSSNWSAFLTELMKKDKTEYSSSQVLICGTD